MTTRNIPDDQVNCYNCKQQCICKYFALNKERLDQLYASFNNVARVIEKKRFDLSNDCKIWICRYGQMFAEQCSQFTLLKSQKE